MGMKSIEPVLHSFAYCLEYLREQVADVVPSDMVVQPNGIMNHPAWVIGHLTHTCQLLGSVIGLPEWLPKYWAKRFSTGSVPVADAGLYETKHNTLVMLGDAQVRITHAIEELDDSRLDEPFPDESYREVFPTIRHALTQVLVGIRRITLDKFQFGAEQWVCHQWGAPLSDSTEGDL